MRPENAQPEPNQATPSEGQTTTQPKQENYIKFTKGDNLEEYNDDVAVLTEKARALANYIKQSKHCIVFTGAGISTSAKLPEYLLNVILLLYIYLYIILKIDF